MNILVGVAHLILAINGSRLEDINPIDGTTVCATALTGILVGFDCAYICQFDSA